MSHSFYHQNSKAFFLVFLLFIVFTVTSCAEKQAVVDEFTVHKDEAGKMLDDIAPTGRIRPALVTDEKLWFGHQAIRMRNGDPLPNHLVAPDSLVMTFEKPLSLKELGKQIQIATGIRVVVVEGTFDDATSQGNEGGFLPLDGVEVAGGRVMWQGNLQGLLNQVADLFDVDWTFRNGIITLREEVTYTFTLHALAGQVDVSGSVETGSTGEAGNLPTQSVDTEVTLALWDEVEEAVLSMVGSQGRVTFSPATGTITLRSAPSVARVVEDYLRYQNRMRIRRVAVTVRVLSVTLANENNVGFDLEGVLDDAFGNQPFLFSSTATGGLTSAIVRNFPSADNDVGGDLTTGGAEKDSVQAVLNALAEKNKVSIVNTGTVVTLSDQPAPLQVSRQVTYIARVTAAATTDSSSTSVEPGTVEEGLTLNVLPRVIEKDRVLLRLGLGITQITEIIEREFDDLIIQLPDLETTGFLQNIMLSSGETLVLSGFERNTTNDVERGTGTAENIFLGGRREFNRERNATVLMISADILPEDPFGVLKR